MCRLLIDADGCPVVAEAVRLAQEFSLSCIIFCDTAHEIYHPGVETRIVSKGPDSVDFALVHQLLRGDIVITQDYSLAAMCLTRGAYCLNQDGMRYSADNIDALLSMRHTAAKIRRVGGRLKGPAKRTATQNLTFSTELEALLRTLIPPKL